MRSPAPIHPEEIEEADLVTAAIAGLLPYRVVDLLWFHGIRRLGDILYRGSDLRYLSCFRARHEAELRELQDSILWAIVIARSSQHDLRPNFDSTIPLPL